jgi:glycosyltransferase involved in cell wall biosynthesis
VEPVRNIALVRNRAILEAEGQFVAFIDDDEFPVPGWLAEMVDLCNRVGCDGVLGPVRPFFDDPPPEWLVRGRFHDRAEHPTETILNWKDTRTGNVLLRREVLDEAGPAFRAEFGNGGEDQDFFRRAMARGRRFVWCNEAVVYEVVPPERWRRSYLLKRALLRGQNEKLILSFRSVVKSLIAAPIYLLSLPLMLLLGQHYFMRYAIRLLDHAGKLLCAVGINAVRGHYLNG